MKVERLQLEEDEHILLQVRKHWFVLSMQLCGVLLLSILPLVGWMLLYDVSMLQNFTRAADTAMLIALYSGWLILMWMLAFSVWTNYYLDVWTITNKRLIVVDQHGFFSRSTASFRLERLQDIIVSVSGIIATLLDFGSLEIQTAGEEKNFKASGLPSPGDIKATILSSTDTLISQNPKTTLSV